MNEHRDGTLWRRVGARSPVWDQEKAPMLKVCIAVLAATAALASVPAFAGDRNVNHNSANASAGAYNENNSSISNSIKNRVQAGTPGSFGGGGPCPQYFALGFPGGSIAAGDTCKEGKQQMKASTVDNYFGRKATRDYLCSSDSSLYGLDYCVQRRIQKSGVRQQQDRARN